ncbi:hypothetical protein [Pantoea sp. 18069]|uniref:hypothetical protein n=1 Tax=Pantoea sp. 18069 TaxID=2681415 RepID=UPI0034D5815E
MLRHLDTAGGQHQRCSRHGLDQTAVQAGTGGGEAGVGQVVGTRLTAQVQETIDNQAGTLSAASDLSLSARNLANNAQVRIVSNAGSVHLAMSGTLSNRQGEITTASHGNLQIAKSKIDSEYASVNEQSGLKAGNGGFIIDVAKDTDLRGAVISSTQQAIDDKKNTFHTGGELTTSDIENIARYKAQGFSASGGMTPSQKGLTPTGGMGIGHKSSNATSTTYSGISGIAGKADIRTGDSETGVMNSFDAQKVREDVDAQVEITKQAGKNLSRTIGDYGQEKKEEAVDLLTQAEAIKESNPELSEELQHNAIQIEKDWGDNGNWRIGLHAIAGGLTGGIGGALGGAVGSATAPQVAAMLDDADIQGPLADTLVAAASTVAATTVGGTAGVAAGLNEVINNSLGHQAVNKLKNCLSGKSCKSDEEKELAIRWAEESSQKIDEETKSICGRDPVGDACRNAISTATKYVAMRDAWDFMKKDVARSSVSLFDYVYNSDAAKERINLYYSTIDKRADFFAASNLYEKNMGAGVKWYEGAEFVSRAPWTGLGADGNFSYLTFGVGRALAPVYSWREAAGKELMSGGFNNFRGVYNDKKSNPIAWDINQLQDEQKILQPIHEKYLGGGYGIFRKSIKFFTDEKLDILNGRQTIENGIDILDLDSRVKYGCKLLGYGAEQGCK